MGEAGGDFDDEHLFAVEPSDFWTRQDERRFTAQPRGECLFSQSIHVANAFDCLALRFYAQEYGSALGIGESGKRFREVRHRCVL